MAMKLFRRNDDQYPEVVIGITFFLIFDAILMTIFCLILMHDPKETIAAIITGTLAVFGWAGLVLCGYKWGNIRA